MYNDSKHCKPGFSLVEIIIVIAIMAILIGVIALAVIPNIQKSRESKDLAYLDNMLSSLNVAAANVSPDSSDLKSDTIDNLLSGTSDFAKEFKKNVGETGPAPYSSAASKNGSVARYKLSMSSGKRAEISVWYGSDADPSHANATDYTKNEQSVFLITN